MSVAKKRAAQAMTVSRITSRGQATVPAIVRRKLDLKPKDSLVFEEFPNGSIPICKAKPLDLEFLSAVEGTLSEWNSDNDDQAYRDL
jgi:antitoxin PrlF